MLRFVAPPRPGVEAFSLIFIGALSMSLINPMMGLFIIEELNEPAWKVSIYSGLVAALTVFVNTTAGKKLDQSAPVRPLLLGAALFFVIFCTLQLGNRSFWLLLFVGGPVISLANSAMTISFSYGRFVAKQNQYDPAKSNAWLRMAVSLAWIVGPASSFSLIASSGFQTAFLWAGIGGLIWFLLTFLIVPNGYQGPEKPKTGDLLNNGSRGLWLAATSTVFFIISNALFMATMPIYFVRELGLPDYAPGLVITVKCILEIVAIFIASRLASLFGPRFILIASAVVAAIVMALFANITTLQAVIMAAALEGISYGLFAGVAITYVQSFAPETPGKATSIYMNSILLGTTAGTVSMGFIASAWDFRTVIYFSLVAALISLIALLLTTQKQPAEA